MARAASRSAPCIALALSLACSPAKPVIEGKVVDIWGTPIEGATVMIEGGTERPLTDSRGRYHIARIDGPHTVKAGRKGFIQEHQTIRIDPEAVEVSGPTFTLYPQPETFGLFVVMHDRYAAITPVRVHAVGTALRTYRGIKNAGDVVPEGTRPRVLWHTDLPQEDIMRLGLELRRLDFVRRAELTTGMGGTDVAVNLYIDAGQVPTEFTALRSRSDYLVAPTEELAQGVYAFQTQELLSDADGAIWGELPPELREVHPFEVR